MSLLRPNELSYPYVMSTLAKDSIDLLASIVTEVCSYPHEPDVLKFAVSYILTADPRTALTEMVQEAQRAVIVTNTHVRRFIEMIEQRFFTLFNLEHHEMLAGKLASGLMPHDVHTTGNAFYPKDYVIRWLTTDEIRQSLLASRPLFIYIMLHLVPATCYLGLERGDI